MFIDVFSSPSLLPTVYPQEHASQSPAKEKSQQEARRNGRLEGLKRVGQARKKRKAEAEAVAESDSDSS